MVEKLIKPYTIRLTEPEYAALYRAAGEHGIKAAQLVRRRLALRGGTAPEAAPGAPDPVRPPIDSHETTVSMTSSSLSASNENRHIPRYHVDQLGPDDLRRNNGAMPR